MCYILLPTIYLIPDICIQLFIQDNEQPKWVPFFKQAYMVSFADFTLGEAADRGSRLLSRSIVFHHHHDHALQEGLTWEDLLM